MAEENSELNPEICVIGAGPGGLAAAAAAATMGVSVVLIEKGRMGGQSLHAGAVPARALQAAAGHANALRVGASFGVKNVRSGIDFAAVNAHVRRAVEAIAPQDSSERFKGLGVRVIAGAARFKDSGTVTAGAATVRARHFIIATGSTPIIPPIPGLADTPYLTPETVFDLADCPRHLLILGAGRTGLELGQTFRRLGSEVTIFEMERPLRHEDRECAAIVLDALGDEGVRLRNGVQIAQVRACWRGSKPLSLGRPSRTRGLRAKRWWKDRTFCSQRDDGQASAISILMRPASATIRMESWSTHAFAPPTKMSMRSVT